MTTLFTKDGAVKERRRILIQNEEAMVLCPSDEVLEANGWARYVEPEAQTTPGISPYEAVQRLITRQFNERTDIANDEALEYMVLIYPWESFIGQSLPAGKIVAYGDKVWRVRQIHTALDTYPPSLDTASLYEAIDKEHAGTEADPIPYTPPMEIFEGKYYVEADVVYRCTRNSDVALTHNLSDLVGVYVESLTTE